MLQTFLKYRATNYYTMKTKSNQTGRCRWWWHRCWHCTKHKHTITSMKSTSSKISTSMHYSSTTWSGNSTLEKLWKRHDKNTNTYCTTDEQQLSAVQSVVELSIHNHYCRHVCNQCLNYILVIAEYKHTNLFCHCHLSGHKTISSFHNCDIFH